MHALPGDGQNRPSVGDSLVQIQERYNTLSNIQAETYEYGIPPIPDTAIHFTDAAGESLYVDIDQVYANGNATSTFFATDVNTIIENWSRFQITYGTDWRFGEPANPVQIDDIHMHDGEFQTQVGCNPWGLFQYTNIGSTGLMEWHNILLEGPVTAGCTPAEMPWFRLGGAGLVETTFTDVEFAPENSATAGPTFTSTPGSIPSGGIWFTRSPLGSIGTGGIFDWSNTGGSPEILVRESGMGAQAGNQVWKAASDNNGIFCENSNVSPTQTLFNTNGALNLKNCKGFAVAGVSLDRIDYPIGTTTNLIERNDSTVVNLFVVENSGDIKEVEAAAPSGAAGFDKLYADSTAHRFKMNNNNGTAMAVSGIVASGTAALGTSSLASGACATAVTVSAPGVLTTDTITYTPNADISGVTGYGSVNGPLTIYPYPTADNINFKVCNWTAISYTPGAVTLNWKVIR